MILITHHMSETINADRLVIMSDGKIIQDGRPGQVFIHVEELKAAGLTVPETTQLLYGLRREGVHLPLDALSVEECAQAIYAMLSEKRG